MRTMRIGMCFLLLLLFYAQLALSASLSADGAIDQAGFTMLKIKAELPGGEGTPFSIEIAGSAPTSVVVRDRSGLELDAKTVREGNWTRIEATVPVDYVEFELGSDSLTEKKDGSWTFELGLKASEQLESMSVEVVLPKGATLKGTNGAVRNEGEALALVWRVENVAEGAETRMQAQYEQMAIPAEGSDSWVFVVAFLMVLVFGYLVMKNGREVARDAAQVGSLAGQLKDELEADGKAQGLKGKRKQELGRTRERQESTKPMKLEASAVFKTLEETEKQIVREVWERGGKTTQAQIYMNTHIPKATLSRRLASLANRGIIQTSRKGNRNLVSIAPGIFDR